MMAVSTERDKLQKELQRTDEIQVSVTGRKSGRPLTNTVWLVLEGNTLYLLPVKGSDTQWFKNLLERPTIKISAGGAQGEFSATAVTDPNIVPSVVKKFQDKYGVGDVKKYYSKFDAAVVVNLD
jgi:deazaflavin-dependent oxidoreductase (nitroreductase family)